MQTTSVIFIGWFLRVVDDVSAVDSDVTTTEVDYVRFLTASWTSDFHFAPFDELFI